MASRSVAHTRPSAQRSHKQRQCEGIGSERNMCQLIDTANSGYNVIQLNITDEVLIMSYLVESVNFNVGVGALLNNLQNRGHYASM